MRTSAPLFSRSQIRRNCDGPASGPMNSPPQLQLASTVAAESTSKSTVEIPPVLSSSVIHDETCSPNRDGAPAHERLTTRIAASKQCVATSSSMPGRQPGHSCAGGCRDGASGRKSRRASRCSALGLDCRVTELPGGRDGWSPSVVRRWARPPRPKAEYAARGHRYGSPSSTATTRTFAPPRRPFTSSSSPRPPNIRAQAPGERR